MDDENILGWLQYKNLFLKAFSSLVLIFTEGLDVWLVASLVAGERV